MMLDFLKEYNISDLTIKKIEKENSRANIYNLSCNKDEVIKILNYFRKLALNCIDELLIYRIELFFNSYEDILNCFSNYDIKDLAIKLNENYMFIDEIN